MLEGEKTSIFWTGLTILDLASVFLLKTIVRLRYASTLIDASEGLTEFIWSTIPLIVGEIVFIVVGLLMMRSGIRRNRPPWARRRVLTLFRGEKTPIFWVGLFIVGLASLVLFAEVWSYRYYEAGTGVFFFIHLDSVSIIFGAVVFILLGLCMMRSGVKRDKPQTRSYFLRGSFWCVRKTLAKI